jgi:hypothetical protein
MNGVWVENECKAEKKSRIGSWNFEDRGREGRLS